MVAATAVTWRTRRSTSSRKTALTTTAAGTAIFRVIDASAEIAWSLNINRASVAACATVTAGGLVFVAGTQDEKIRAFDADTGKELWQAKLPHAGTSAPAVYEVNGQQFVVVPATGGGRVGGASGPGDTYVAFALKK